MAWKVMFQHIEKLLIVMRSQLLEGPKYESQIEDNEKESGHVPWLAALKRGRGAC